MARAIPSIRNRFATLAILVIALATAAAGSAQDASQFQFTAGVREHLLPNGLRVLTKEVRVAPVVNFSVWYRVGSRNEHNGITGASHLLEHMLFKGTKKTPLGVLDRTLFANGARFNAGTYYDWTNYHETIASDRVEVAIRLEADRMRGALIRAEDLAAEMSVVRSELEGNENNPGTLLGQAVWATAFQQHAYHWPIIGYRADVENISADKLRRYYQTYYGPNNAVAIIVGDFDTDELMKLIRKHFGRIKPIPTPPPVYTQEPVQQGERRTVLRRGARLNYVHIGYRGPKGDHADMDVLDVIGSILSTGNTSRLYQGLVRPGIAVGATAGAPTLKDPTLFSFRATSPLTVEHETLEKALLDQVDRLRKEPVTAAELARAKRQIETDFIYSQDTVTQQARSLGYYEMVRSYKYVDQYLAHIRKVTPDEVRAVAQRYFKPEARTIGWLIPTENASPTPPTRPEANGGGEPSKRSERRIKLPKPSAGPKRKRQTFKTRLDNGITLIVQENHANATFAISGSLPAGRAYGPAGSPGLASLTAQMINRGAGDRTGLQIARELGDVAASLRIGATTLIASISGRALSRDFDLTLDILADMLQRPTFPEDELRTVRTRALAGIERARDDPHSRATRALDRALYPEGHPLRPSTLDEAEAALRRYTRADLERYHRQQYGPDNAVLVFVGDLKAEEVARKVKEKLGGWARNPRAKVMTIPDLPTTIKARIETPLKDKAETAIYYGFAGGLKRSDPDFYAAQAMNLILGGGGAIASRLGHTIREEQGLAYNIFSFFDAGKFAGPWMAGMGVNPVNVDQAIASLEAEIKRMREEGPTDRELQEAISYVTGSFPLRLESNAGLADVLNIMQDYDLGDDYIEKYASNYHAVTPEQARAAAKRHLPPNGVLSIAGTF